MILLQAVPAAASFKDYLPIFTTIFGGAAAMVIQAIWGRKKAKAEENEIISNTYTQLIENLTEQNKNYEERFKAQAILIEGVLQSDKVIIENSNLIMQNRQKLIERIEHLEEAEKERNKLRVELNEKVEKLTETLAERDHLATRILELEKEVEKLKSQMGQSPTQA